MRRQDRDISETLALGRSVRARAVEKRHLAVTFDRVMQTMSQDVTTITAPHETTCARMALDSNMTGRLVHHRGVEVLVTTCALHYGRVPCHAKKEAAIVATTTVRAISITIAATEDRKSDSNEDHVKATAMTSAKPHVISRLHGGSRLLDKASLPRSF